MNSAGGRDWDEVQPRGSKRVSQQLRSSNSEAERAVATLARWVRATGDRSIDDVASETVDRLLATA